MDKPVMQRERHAFDRGRAVARQVEDLLRDRILSLDLLPGAVLSRNELVAEFGLSNTPVRDALLRLEEEGLVRVYPQHATIVSRIDLGAARQVHFLRRAVEIEAVRAICDLSDVAPVVAELTQIIRQMTSRLASEEMAAFSVIDRDFHRVILTAAGVPDLGAIIRRASGHIDRLRRLDLMDAGKAERIIADHRAIVEAIASRDPARAATAMRDHLSGTLAMVDRIRERFPDYLIE